MLVGTDSTMSLKEYNRKRDFKISSEPVGEDKTSLESKTYLIHRHEASHLHWDLRLEMDGILKSWAIPKEPPLEFGIKRLAVQVEDHPLEYANFSGVIPDSQYGAGVVEIWDKGTYTAVSVKDEKLIVDIKGMKLKGKYVLVKTKFGKGNNWLFFKMKEQ